MAQEPEIKVPNPTKKKNFLAIYAVSALVGAGLLGATLQNPNIANAQQIAIAPPTGAPMSFADLIERVSPAVVSISVKARAPEAAANSPFEYGGEGAPDEEFDFRKFFGDPGGRGQQKAPEIRSMGSGFVINEGGNIVTNFHVIDGAEEITVALKDGREIEADLVGADKATDLAVLKLREKGPYKFVSFDTAEDIRVGDWVVAVGNPFGLGGTATAGIVSADGRKIGGPYTDFLQIDAPINRGNSGGPTFDLKGRVIGVNSAIFSPSGGNVGIGFAIPSTTAARVVDALMKNGRVARGWLGVSVQDVNKDIASGLGLKDAKGAIISSVVDGGPAAKGGFRSGDVVLTINGKKVDDAGDLTRQVGDLGAGKNVPVEVLRDGKRQSMRVTVGDRPSEEKLASLDYRRSNDTPAPGAAAAGGTEALGMAFGALRPDDRTRLGLTKDEPGALVTDVDPDSEAGQRGMRAGVAILEAGGKAVRSAADVNRAVSDAKRDGRETVLLLVQVRQGARIWLPVPVTKGG
ncbi:MAG: Do family serine endopeptidase [Caulobacterales bacterium]